MMMDTQEEYICEELDKHRRKLKDISSSLDQQYQMLRLIIQKMEIRTEADDVDEGVSPHELKSPMGHVGALSTQSRWNSPKIRKKLKQALSFSNK